MDSQPLHHISSSDIRRIVCFPYWAATVIQAPSFALRPTPLRKVVQTLQEVRRTSTAQRKAHATGNNLTTNAANMSSIDAIVNAGPSSQQLRDNDDDPAEKFDALNVREDSEGWNDVEEDNEEFNVQCLFCTESSSSLAQALSHMKAEHQFDLVNFRSRQGG